MSKKFYLIDIQILYISFKLNYIPYKNTKYKISNFALNKY